MVGKQIAAVLTIIGGVFYMIGSIVGAFLSVMTFSFLGGLMGATSNRGFNSGGAMSAAGAVFTFGIFSGVLIIVAGAMMNSDQGSWRRSGGVLAIVMMVLGALPSLGGVVVGFFFTLVGAVIGLTYKGQPDIVIGTVPMPSYQAPMPPHQAVSTPVVKGQVKFCIKCGSPLHAGAVFCASCGAAVPQS